MWQAIVGITGPPVTRLAYSRMIPSPASATIARDRQNCQLAAAMSVSHGAVLRLESAVYVDPIPSPGVADIVEQQVVLLGPEERNCVEALARPEHVAGRRLALAFGHDPMLDADGLAGQPVGPTGDVACSIDARNAGLQILTDHDAAIDGYPGLLSECGPRPHPDTDDDKVGFEPFPALQCDPVPIECSGRRAKVEDDAVLLMHAAY
jgi:hypothetical protein